jgi:hypothetical protein
MNVAMRARIILIPVYSPGCVSTSIDPEYVVSDGEAKASTFSSRLVVQRRAGRHSHREHAAAERAAVTTSAVPLDRGVHLVARATKTQIGK